MNILATTKFCVYTKVVFILIFCIMIYSAQTQLTDQTVLLLTMYIYMIATLKLKAFSHRFLFLL